MLVTKPAVTTDGGFNLRILNIRGERIEFTKLEVGSGQYSNEEATEEALCRRTSLKARKQQFGISSMTATEDGKELILSSMITNADLDEGYTIRELGLYAQIYGMPDTERLVSISLAEIEDDFPAYDGKPESRILMKYHFAVSNSDTVYLSYEHDPVALVEYVDESIKKLCTTQYLEDAFYDAFTYLMREESHAMSSADILRAINTEWGGESSDDPNALSAVEVTAALSSEWNGETSSDPNALSAAQISEILTAPEGEQLTAAEIAALLS